MTHTTEFKTVPEDASPYAVSSAAVVAMPSYASVTTVDVVVDSSTTRKVQVDRARELAEDTAAIKTEADGIRGRPLSSFKTLDEFEQELED